MYQDIGTFIVGFEFFNGYNLSTHSPKLFILSQPFQFYIHFLHNPYQANNVILMNIIHLYNSKNLSQIQVYEYVDVKKFINKLLINFINIS